MTRRFLFTVVAALGAWVGAASPAAAQGGFDPAIISSTTIAQDQKEAIRTFAGAALAKLKNADNPVEMKRGRDDLLEQLKPAKGPTVAFRQAYSEALVNELKDLAKGEEDKVAINALIVSGELATPDSATILESHLGDKRTAVRFAAANNMARTFEALSKSSPAMPPDRVKAMTEALGEMVARDNDAEPLDAAVRSLIAGLALQKQEHAPAREAALSALAKRCGERLKKADAADDATARAMLRAITGIRNAVSAGAPFKPEGYHASGKLCRDAIDYIRRNLPAFQQRPAETRTVQEAILNETENLATAASSKLGGPAYQPRGLSTDFAKNDRAVSTKLLDALKWFGDPPFRLALETNPPPGGG